MFLVRGPTAYSEDATMIQFLSGKKPNKAISPLEADAFGAAVQVAILIGEGSPLLQSCGQCARAKSTSRRPHKPQ